MIISDLVTTKEIRKDNINGENWCSYIYGTLTKENYLWSVRDAVFQNNQILNEKIYMNENHFSDRRKVISIIVKAITNYVITIIKFYEKFSLKKDYKSIVFVYVENAGNQKEKVL